jgi:prepilin signal peptidase PulO-like enzyme (type II secretory pathway)
LIGGLLAWKAKERLKKIPYGPYMVAGALVGVLVGEYVWLWYLVTFFPALA